MIKFEIQKKQLQQILKTHLEYAAGYQMSNILCGILLSVKADTMNFYSSDGNRLLKTQLKLDKKYKEFKAIYSANSLSKLKFVKGNIDSCIDNLEITINEEEMVIFDMYNNFTYKIKPMPGEYPDVENILKISKKININLL